MAISRERETELVERVLSVRGAEHITVEPKLYTAPNGVLITRNGLRVYLHRRLWDRVMNVRVPQYHWLFRTCDEPLCVNPYHRDMRRNTTSSTACTQGHSREQGERLPSGRWRCLVCNPRKPHAEASRTHCPHGHPYNEKNTYTHPKANGSTGRQCRTCRSARSRGIDPATIEYEE